MCSAPPPLQEPAAAPMVETRTRLLAVRSISLRESPTLWPTAGDATLAKVVPVPLVDPEGDHAGAER
eukprot:8361018-Lingulodinium_polyedra.AAC.1